MIHTLSIEITTHCSKRCENCCAGVGINRVLSHHPWEYFVSAAARVRGIYRIHITGGEPTMHPQFADFAPKFRDLFGCRVLSLGTNGYKMAEYEDLIVQTFDFVNVSDYGDRGAALQSLSARMKVNVENMGPNGALFVPRSAPGGGRPCTRAAWRSHSTVFADGQIWGCCVAPGLNGAQGLPLDEHWQDAAMLAKTPCDTCFFSE